MKKNGNDRAGNESKNKSREKRKQGKSSRLDSFSSGPSMSLTCTCPEIIPVLPGYFKWGLCFVNGIHLTCRFLPISQNVKLGPLKLKRWDISI